eukprot:2902468-Amphidinium_carterae.1
MEYDEHKDQLLSGRSGCCYSKEPEIMTISYGHMRIHQCLQADLRPSRHTSKSCTIETIRLITKPGTKPVL